jgi:hypothetical protein
MNHIVIPGIILALAVAGLALWFAGHQWAERRRRPLDLSAEDTAYFRGKDHRRLAGSVLMGTIAVAMAVGLWIDPRSGAEAARTWVASWSTVLSLLLVLLVLALWDWLALHAYARRHRSALLREREVLMNDLLRLGRESRTPGTEGE